MRKVIAEFRRDDNSVQEVDITHCNLDWIIERANQIDGLMFTNKAASHYCTKCGKDMDDYPGWQKRCNNCFNQ